MFIRAERATSLVLGVYATLVVSLLGLLPFWLDEVLQLAGTHPGATSADVIRYVPQNPGGVPLGYLVQHWVLDIGGLSRWTARLTAAVFGVATCAAVGALAAWLGMRMAWVAVLLFATLPLILRYSTEGRPYSFALFLSVAATLAFIRFAREQSPAASFVTYLILLVAGLYTQPFTILVGAGHGLWAIWERRWRLALATGAAVSVAALSFVPWLLYARGAWRSTIAANQFQFVWTARTPLMILREFSGAGRG